MNSEERLVATVARELLAANLAIESIGPIVLEEDAEALSLPCTVLSAKFEDEEEGSGLPKRYTLTVELRFLPRTHPAATMDEVFRAIGSALDPSVAPAAPATFTSSFNYYRIEAQIGTESETGETNTRTRSYTVFARLL